MASSGVVYRTVYRGERGPIIITAPVPGDKQHLKTSWRLTSCGKSIPASLIIPPTTFTTDMNERNVVLAHRMAQMVRAAHFCLVSMVTNKQTWLGAFKWIFIDSWRAILTCTVWALRLWLTIGPYKVSTEIMSFGFTLRLIYWYSDFELNIIIYKIARCMPSFNHMIIGVSNNNYTLHIFNLHWKFLIERIKVISHTYYLAFPASFL